MRSAGIDARSGALGKRFDAYPWRHPVTESSYINSLANRPHRSTVKTLPATLPEPWTTVRGPRSKQKGPWSTDLEPRIVDRVSRFKLRGSCLVDAEPGLLGSAVSAVSISNKRCLIHPTFISQALTITTDRSGLRDWSVPTSSRRFSHDSCPSGTVVSITDMA